MPSYPPTGLQFSHIVKNKDRRVGISPSGENAMFHLAVPRFDNPALAPNSSFLLTQTLEGSGDESSSWVPLPTWDTCIELQALAQTNLLQALEKRIYRQECALYHPCLNELFQESFKRGMAFFKRSMYFTWKEDLQRGEREGKIFNLLVSYPGDQNTHS